MRTSPTFASTAANTFILYQSGVGSAGTVIALDGANTEAAGISVTVASGLTAGYATNLRSNNTTAYLEFSSEL